MVVLSAHLLRKILSKPQGMVGLFIFFARTFCSRCLDLKGERRRSFWSNSVCVCGAMRSRTQYVEPDSVCVCVSSYGRSYCRAMRARTVEPWEVVLLSHGRSYCRVMGGRTVKSWEVVLSSHGRSYCRVMGGRPVVLRKDVLSCHGRSYCRVTEGRP